jgi:hypothetical protein
LTVEVVVFPWNHQLGGRVVAEIPPHLHSALQGIVSEIFQAGVKAGAEQMRSAILQAAQAPMERSEAVPKRAASESYQHTQPEGSRAPRGSVRRAITAALKAYSSLGELEVGRKAAEIDPSVSPRSVGGELRRMRDRLYRFDRGQWFLIAQESGKEAAGPQNDPADLLNQTDTGVPYAETPIAA